MENRWAQRFFSDCPEPLTSCDTMPSKIWTTVDVNTIVGQILTHDPWPIGTSGQKLTTKIIFLGAPKWKIKGPEVMCYHPVA